MACRLNAVEDLLGPLPGGIFFAFARFDQDLSTVEQTLRIGRAGVICTPGTPDTPCGLFREGHLRFSYATDSQTFEAALDNRNRGDGGALAGKSHVNC